MVVSVIQSNIRDLPFKIADKKEHKWWYKILVHILPSPRQINLYVAKIIIGVFLYAILYGMLGDQALPGSEVFALFVIILSAVIGGKIIGLLNLPPLIGMLLVGFTYRNVHSLSFYHDISKKTIVTLREIALSIILLRAGIGLDGESLKKLKFIVLRLTVLPCLTEVISMGIFGHFLLNLPFIFSFMLGFIISAISPEVVLPPVLQLERERYGIKKGIPALIIGATSLDDILAIAGFTICFSIAFSTKDLVWTLIKAPLEPIVGFIFAVIFGIIFWYFPSKNTAKKGVYSATLIMWSIVEPILFSLIGAEITIEVLKDNAGYAVLALVSSLLCRTLMTGCVIFGANLNIKEKIFVCCSYLPKASVQAAIGSQALDYARAHDKGEELLRYGLTVLNVCVLSLLLTAPIAAILINTLGRVLLTKDDPSMHPEEDIEPSDEEETEAGSKKFLVDRSSVNVLRMQKDD